MDNQSQSLASIFQAVGWALQKNQKALNQSDPDHGNHGDQMVEVFNIATRAAAELSSNSLSESMTFAASQLEEARGNDIAQIYAHGLSEMGYQLKINQVSLENLILSIKSTLREDDTSQNSHQDTGKETRKGQVIKSLLAGLAGWNRVEDGKQRVGSPLDFGALVGIGMAYMQAKQRNRERIDVLADAAASASPLGKNQCYYKSGVIVIRALLQALNQTAG